MPRKRKNGREPAANAAAGEEDQDVTHFILKVLRGDQPVDLQVRRDADLRGVLVDVRSGVLVVDFVL